MAYQNTLQADALKLVAKKLQSSLAVEGELPEDGLAAYGDDLMLALARKVIAGEGTRTRSSRSSPRPSRSRRKPRRWWWTLGGVGPEPVAVELVTAGEPVEARRSVFSWAMFLAEKPAEPGRRRRKPPGSLPQGGAWPDRG